MRIDKRIPKIYSDEIEQFFVGLWYSAVHYEALDSHRVRSMGALNASEELLSLLTKRFARDNQKDVPLVAAEMFSLLEHDRIVVEQFGSHVDALKPLLGQIRNPIKEPEEQYALTSYYVKAFISDLKLRYKPLVIEALEAALFTTKSKSEVFRHTHTLLTLLMHEGHNQEGLFSLVRDVFISFKSEQPRTFMERFEFLKWLINKDTSEYFVVLRLQGDVPDVFLNYQVPNVRFCRSIAEPSELAEDTRYAIAEPRKVLAVLTVQARDDRSAGTKAQEIVGDHVDLLNFALSSSLSITPQFVAIRNEDNNLGRYSLPPRVPNPNFGVASHKFDAFMNSLISVQNRADLDEESKKRIRSALRFYRIGREEDQIENKFLNWWLALEYLVGRDRDSIITGIEKKLSAVLLLGYVSKYLESYKEVLPIIGVAPKVATHLADYTSFKDVPALELLETLRDSANAEAIISACADYPHFAFQLDWFHSQIVDSATLTKFLERHRDRVKAQIHRVYRVRNDIVHSAGYALNITLLCANLEYYLRQTILFVVHNLGQGAASQSLEETYARADHICTFLCDKKNTDTLQRLQHLIQGGTV